MAAATYDLSLSHKKRNPTSSELGLLDLIFN
jgi:hypothetical protein